MIALDWVAFGLNFDELAAAVETLLMVAESCWGFEALSEIAETIAEVIAWTVSEIETDWIVTATAAVETADLARTGLVVAVVGTLN